MSTQHDSTDSARTVVVLGGGVGGVVAATRLRKTLPRQHRVLLVDRNREHLFAPSLLWLMVGDRTGAQISRSLDRLAKKGIEVVIGDVDRIDPAGRRVGVVELQGSEAVTRDIDFDHLVVSLGAELVPEAILDLAAAGHNLYTLAGAESLKEALERFDGGRIVVLTAAPAYKCPAAPYEAAMLIDDHLRKRNIRGRTDLDLYAAEPAPMGVTGPDVSAGVVSMLEAKGIGYHPGQQIERADAASRLLIFANGTAVEYDLLAYVPPHRAPSVARESGLVDDDSGWIPTDRDTLHTAFAGVWAIGDITGIPLKMGKPLPMAGVFAERQAKVVANNIVHDITGKGEPAWFDGHGECFIETGAGKAGFGRGDFYAEPNPQVKLHAPGRRWHYAKLLFERNWFRRWF